MTWFLIWAVGAIAVLALGWLKMPRARSRRAMRFHRAALIVVAAFWPGALISGAVFAVALAAWWSNRRVRKAWRSI